MRKFIYDNNKRFNGSDLEPFIIWCVEQETSDITIQSDEQIICEIYGNKHKVTDRKLSKSELIIIITEIFKSEGAVSTLNSGLEVDTAWSIKISREKRLRFRVNMKAIGSQDDKGYSITLRVIKNKPPEVDELNLEAEILRIFGSKKGLAITTGETGSGKSTLLASVITWKIKNPEAHLKVATYESPIEFLYDDVIKPTSTVSQVEIGVHIETYELAIKNSLRCAADLILIGEMRDKESIIAGINVAMTGSQVFTTLHSNGVADAISRMVNVFNFDERQSRIIDLLSCLKIIVAQKLIPTIDGKQVAIREFLIFNRTITDALIDAGIHKITYKTRELLEKYGQTFQQDLLKKYEQKIISEKVYNEIKESLS